MEYVTQEGVFSISNGLRGRPRCHHHTSYTTTNTYKTTQNNHVLQDHAGKETLGSTHTSSTEKIASRTTSSTSTKKWFEMHAGGMEREAISELISSGKATLRPSYQMLSRLYEAKVSGQ